MLSTVKSTTQDAPPQLQGAISREMVMEMITSALSYMPELGGVVKHRSIEGELWLRIRFEEIDIVPVTEDAGAVYFKLVPVLATKPTNTGTEEKTE